MSFNIVLVVHMLFKDFYREKDLNLSLYMYIQVSVVRGIYFMYQYKSNTSKRSS